MIYADISVTVQADNFIRENITSGFVGQSVQLECKVKWDHLRVMAWYFEEKKIFQFQEGDEKYPSGETDKYVVTRFGQRFILNIKDLNLKDEGTYYCATLTSEGTVRLL